MHQLVLNPIFFVCPYIYILLISMPEVRPPPPPNLSMNMTLRVWNWGSATSTEVSLPSSPDPLQCILGVKCYAGLEGMCTGWAGAGKGWAGGGRALEKYSCPADIIRQAIQELGEGVGGGGTKATRIKKRMRSQSLWTITLASHRMRQDVGGCLETDNFRSGKSGPRWAPTSLSSHEVILLSTWSSQACSPAPVFV